MNISIVHGYFLNGTGSNLYVQNLCRQFCIMGHDVMLFCQELSMEKYDFIESAYVLDKSNEHLRLIHAKDTPYEGKCRCFIPNIGDILPVYVKDLYEGFDAQEITQISEKDLEFYISSNAMALKTCFLESKPDIVISNHTVLQPVYVKRALEDMEDVFNFTVVHGSCLNFSVKKSKLALRYAIEGINVSDVLVFLSDYALQEFIDYFEGRADFKAKKILIHAGVDIEGFVPLEKGSSKSEAILRLLKKIESEYGVCLGSAEHEKNRSFDKMIKEIPTDRLIDIKTQLMEKGDTKSIDSDIWKKLLHIDWENESIVLYYGKYLWTKGIHNLILSLPFVLQENPNTRLVLVGFGTSRGYLEAIVSALDAGDLKKLKYLLSNPHDFQSHVEPGTELYSNYILEMLEDDDLSAAYLKKTIGTISDKVIFTGFMDHNLLKDLIPCADIAVAPSIFPEAFGLVGVEALACGVFPLQTYHSGFKSVVDSYEELFEMDDNLKALSKLLLTEDLVKKIAFHINTILKSYKNRDLDLIEKVKSTARRISIENYSWSSVAIRFLNEAQIESVNSEK